MDDAQTVCATSFAASAFHSLSIVVDCVGNTLLKAFNVYCIINAFLNVNYIVVYISINNCNQS